MENIRGVVGSPSNDRETLNCPSSPPVRQSTIRMEEKSRASTGSQEQVAPFVAKTYEMVEDPSSDLLIRWGKKNNSFVVADPNDFSHYLLPSFFKHRNFSSFIRQLNTYGFRKVDPDRWEFAHESFLRGQTRLLPLVTRRRKSEGGLHGSSSKDGVEGEEERVLLQELHRLRQEQKALDEEVTVMSRRLQATERRPQQLMSFLVKVAQDPNLLQKLVQSKQQQQASMEKKKRRLSAALPLPKDYGILLPFGEVAAMEPTTFDPLGISGSDDGGLSVRSQPECNLMGTGSGTASLLAFPYSSLDRGFL
ncbi:HSF-type DNA-binding [Musa troglodytarum]|uniref:HSF-type DNA-binding n=1 Tax=Musa troglodytarum TaxID=320322 RepID=A0A9E7HGD4_9LILI|nr:HSF-type DNA-binding [Musa troglodytarum]